MGWFVETKLLFQLLDEFRIQALRTPVFGRTPTAAAFGAGLRGVGTGLEVSATTGNTVCGVAPPVRSVAR